MTKKKEIELLISRYKADIAALEERKGDFMRHIEVLKNLIPSVQVWHMWKTVQKEEIPYSAGSQFSEEEIAKAREHLAHLESVLKELQESVDLIIEEEQVIKKRLDVLERSYEELEDPNRNLLGDAVDMVGKVVPDLNVSVPATLETLKGDEGNPKDNTDWKRVCEDLVKQVGEISENLKNSSKKLEENESQAKQLERQYFDLERELEVKIQMLEGKGRSMISMILEKEEIKGWEEEIGGMESMSSMQEALAEVRSIKETLSKSGLSKKAQSVGTAVQVLTSKDSESLKVGSPPPSSRSGHTDWKQLCQDLIKQVSELSEKVKNSSQELKESEKHAKYLEEECTKLEEELRSKIQLLQKKSGVSISDLGGKEQNENVKEDLEKNNMLSEMERALEEVKSLQGSLQEARSMRKSLSKVSNKSKDIKTPSRLFTAPSKDSEKIFENAEGATKVPSVAGTEVTVKATSKGPSVSSLEEKVSDKAESVTKAASVAETKAKVETTSKGPSVSSLEAKPSDKPDASKSSLAPKSSVSEKTGSQKPTLGSCVKTRLLNFPVEREGVAVQDTIIPPPKQTNVHVGNPITWGMTPSVLNKKEVDMLIARYMADISSLDERKEHFLREIELLEFLKPSIFTYHKSKMYQGVEIPSTAGTPTSQKEIEEEANERLRHLQKETEELLEAVDLIEEEQDLIRKRIVELQKFLSDPLNKLTDKTTDILATSDKVGKEPDKQSQAGDTDWKALSDKLLIEVRELSEKVSNSSKELEESEVYTKYLEEEISKLEKALEKQIKLLGQKTDKPIPVDVKGEQEYLQEELEKEIYKEAIEGALEEVRSLRSSLEEAKSIRESLSKVTSAQGKVQQEIPAESTKKGETILPETSASKEPTSLELEGALLEKTEALQLADSVVSTKEGKTDPPEEPISKSIIEDKATKTEKSIISGSEEMSSDAIHKKGEISAPSEEPTSGEEPEPSETVVIRPLVVSPDSEGIPTDGEISVPSEAAPEEKEEFTDKKPITEIPESTKEDEENLSEKTVLKTLKEIENKSIISSPEEISSNIIPTTGEIRAPSEKATFAEVPEPSKTDITWPQVIPSKSREIPTKVEISGHTEAEPEEKETSSDTKQITDVPESTKESEASPSEKTLLKSIKGDEETKSEKIINSGPEEISSDAVPDTGEIPSKGKISVSSESAPEEKAPSKELVPTSGPAISFDATPKTGEISITSEKNKLREGSKLSKLVISYPQAITSESVEIPTEAEITDPSKAVPVEQDVFPGIKQMTDVPQSAKESGEISPDIIRTREIISLLEGNAVDAPESIPFPDEKDAQISTVSGEKAEASIDAKPLGVSSKTPDEEKTSTDPSKAVPVEQEVFPGIEQMTDVPRNPPDMSPDIIRTTEIISILAGNAVDAPESILFPDEKDAQISTVSGEKAEASIDAKPLAVSSKAPDEEKVTTDVLTDARPISETISKTTRIESQKSSSKEGEALKPIISEPTELVGEFPKIAKGATSGKHEDQLPSEKLPPSLEESPVLETKHTVHDKKTSEDDSLPSKGASEPPKKPGVDEALEHVPVSKAKVASTAGVTPKDVPTIRGEPTPSDKKPSVSDLTAETLQNKLKLKDHLIKTMADQLRELSRNNKWPEKKKFEATASRDPVATYDFDKNTLLLYLKGEEPQDISKALKSNPQYSGSNPLNVKIIRKIDQNSLMIEWGPPPSADVAGFQIFVNGQFLYWVHSAKRNLALLHPLDLKVVTDISVSPIDEQGNIIFRSSVTYKPD